MSDKISLALVGIGNVSSTIVKGLEFYKNSTDGLWHPKIGGLTLNDFTISAVFDIDASKVGKNLNSIVKDFKSDFGNLVIQPGISEDVAPTHISQSGQIKSIGYDEFVTSLKKAKPDFLVNLISSGMEKTSEKYAYPRGHAIPRLHDRLLAGLPVPGWHGRAHRLSALEDPTHPCARRIGRHR